MATLTEWALKVTAQHAAYSNFAPPIRMDIAADQTSSLARRVVAMGHALQAAKSITYLAKKIRNMELEMVELGWSRPAV